MKARRQARMVVLQALYEADSSHHGLEEALENRLTETPLAASSDVFVRQLALGVTKEQAVLDLIIRQIAPEWPLSQLAVVDRAILRMGVYELLLDQSTPLKIVINEAVELAKLFGSETSARFINGALGALADRYNEYDQQVANHRQLSKLA